MAGVLLVNTNVQLSFYVPNLYVFRFEKGMFATIGNTHKVINKVWSFLKYSHANAKNYVRSAL